MGAHKKQRIFSILAILTMAVILTCVFTACGDTGAQDSGKKELSASDIYAQVNPSVVFILIQTNSGYSSGSGFFIDSNGTCVTNQHVIEDGLSGAIQMYDGTTATIDSVVGFDKNLDIAILSTTAKNTTPVKISKTPVQVGDAVYAIGYPEAFKLGFSSSTFTSGMVSMNRSIDGYSYIQSTVDITHGNSGGALINKYGEVVGITTGGITYSNIDYMNLSIPIQRIDNVSRTTNEPLSVVTKRNYPVYATFYSDGEKYITQTLRYEGCAYTPTEPTKTGYTFAGWYADSRFNTKYNFSQKLTTNVSIYAKWTINTYRINYNLNSGSWNGSTPSSEYTINNCGNSLPTPKRSGYIFEGWKDASGSFIYNLPSSSDLKNLSLSASWVEGSEGLSFLTYNSSNYVLVSGYNGSSTSVVIPKTFRGVPVTTIGSSAFKNQTQIKSVTLPVSLTTISSNAFSGCTGLSGIVIPDSVTSVDSTAFSGCTNIASATMPAAIGNCFPNVKNVTISSGTSIQSNAFANCTSLTNITLPQTLASIGNNAFKNCTSLTSITIPNMLSSIGDNAFYGCTNLSEIYNNSSLSLTIGSKDNGYVAYYADVVYKYEKDGYVSTDKNGFVVKVVRNVKTLTSYIGTSTKIVIPDGIHIINSNVFQNNTTITSIVIPNSVTNIGSSAFSGCTGLTSVSIGSGVERMTERIFYNCNRLTSITIPDSVTLIEWYAFSGCTGLTRVTIGSGVTRIGHQAFRGCTGLTSITIPDSVTKIDSLAFGNCTGLTSITIGSGITSIDSQTFWSCTGLTSITIPDSVTSIGYQTFYGCSRLTIVSIGSGVTSIGTEAFTKCIGLTKINVSMDNTEYASVDGVLYDKAKSKIILVPKLVQGSILIRDSVTSIGDSAFEECTELTSISIPDSVISIGSYAFHNCTRLTSIYYTGDIVGWCGISGLGSLMSSSRTLYIGGNKVEGELIIPDSVTSIGGSAFYGCSGLTSIEIPDSVTSIGGSAFYGCSGLTSIEIPDSVTSIGGSAFYGCSGLTSIAIPDGVTSIGDDAFRCCYKLVEVYNKSSLTITMGSSNNGYVAYYAKNVYTTEGGIKLSTDDNGYVIYTDGAELILVAYTGSETELVLPSNITQIYKYAFYGCTGLKSITIPDSVTSIPSYAFYNCSGLTSIVIPDSVTSIGTSAFYNCTGLTSVTIGSGVTSIGDEAFIYCYKLVEVYNKSSLTITVGSSDNGYVAYYAKIVYSTEGGGKLSTDDNGYVIYTEDSEKILVAYIGNETELTLPSYITQINQYAFYGCSKLTSIVIPDGVTSIGNYAFYNCTGLTTVNWNATACTSAGSYYYPIFDGCTNLTTVNIGENVTTIPSYAFSGCKGLTSIVIPDSVTIIGSYAFSGCKGLTSVTIGNGVTSIGSCAFWCCTGLTSITFKGTKAKWNAISKGYIWKYNVPSSCKVYCADGTLTIK